LNEKYLLGVDIGTYQSKGVLVNLKGEIISSYIVSHDLLVPQKGLAEHDAEKVWWGDFNLITKKIFEKSKVDPKKIIAIGCSAIAPAVLPIDKQGNPLRKGILYGIDTRAKEEITELEGLLGKNNIYNKSGNRLSTQSVGPKILWIKKNERHIYNKASKFVTASSFIVGRLTGNYVVDHYTAAAGFTPFYNLSKKKWDKEMCEALIEIEQLPEVLWTTDIAGHVSKEASIYTGLSPGTPVITGTADAAAEAISIGIGKPGDTMLMYGSSFFFISITKKMEEDKRIESAPFLFPESYCLLGGMSTAGTLTRWIVDNTAKELTTKEKNQDDDSFQQLIQEAENIPAGSEGLIALPYFSGERTPINDPLAKGVFFGLSLIHTRAHLFCALLEGIGHGVKSNLDILEGKGYQFKNVTAIGGGTKNHLWTQAISDICNQTQNIPKTIIGASFGSAILAGLGTGEIYSLEDAKKWVETERKVEPNKDNHIVYQKNHEIFLSLYENTKELMHKL